VSENKVKFFRSTAEIVQNYDVFFRLVCYNKWVEIFLIERLIAIDIFSKKVQKTDFDASFQKLQKAHMTSIIYIFFCFSIRLVRNKNRVYLIDKKNVYCVYY